MGSYPSNLMTGEIQCSRCKKFQNPFDVFENDAGTELICKACLKKAGS